MSHKNLNPSVPGRPKRVAIVLSNPAVSSTTGWPVGFWWSELTHPYFKFTEADYEVELFSPQGGRCEADAMSDPEDPSGWQAEDVISRGYKHDPQFVKLIENTRPVDDIDPERLDAMVVTGGQGPMFTFEAATNLHAKFTELYEARRICAAAYEVARRLDQWMVDPVVIWESETMRSHFGRAVFEDLAVDVEIMGAVQKRRSGGPWSAPTDPAMHRRGVSVGPMRVPVLSLEYEADAYDAIGCAERAKLL